MCFVAHAAAVGRSSSVWFWCAMAALCSVLPEWDRTGIVHDGPGFHMSEALLVCASNAADVFFC